MTNMSSVFRISTPETPKRKICEVAMPPPVPIKRRLFSMDEQEDNYMSFPVFPCLDEDDEMMVEEEAVSRNSTPSSLQPRFNEDVDMLLYTPRQSPLSGQDFEIPNIAKVERHRTVCTDDQEIDTIASEDQNMPPPPMIPPLKAGAKMGGTAQAPIRLKLSPSRLQFTPMAA